MFFFLILPPILQSPQSRVRLHAGSGESKHLEIFLPVPAAAQLDCDGNQLENARNLSIQLQCKAKVDVEDRKNLVGWRTIVEEVAKTIVHENALAVLVVLTDSLDQGLLPGLYPPLLGQGELPIFQLVVCPREEFQAWALRRNNVSYENG